MDLSERLCVFAVDWHSMLVPKLPLCDVVLRTLGAYFLLHTGLRVLGRKELQRAASYNMVTLFLVGAFGGRAVLGEDTSLTAAALGLAVVLLLNGLLSYATFRSRRLADLVEGKVYHLIRDGVLQRQALGQARCSVDLLRAELRGKGLTDLNRVAQAYMERTGEISFILRE